MAKLYRVNAGALDLLRTGDSIAEVRAWAKAAFHGSAIKVQRESAYREVCAACDSRPCACTCVKSETQPFGPDWVRRKVDENERGFGRKS